MVDSWMIDQIFRKKLVTSMKKIARRELHRSKWNYKCFEIIIIQGQ